MEIQNILSDRTHNMKGELVITDHINKLIATCTYNPTEHKEGGMLRSFKNKIWKSTSSHLPDRVHLQVE